MKNAQIEKRVEYYELGVNFFLPFCSKFKRLKLEKILK